MFSKAVLLLSLLFVISSATRDTFKRTPSLLDYLKSPMLMGYAPQEYNKELPNLQYLMYLRDPPHGANSMLTFP